MKPIVLALLTLVLIVAGSSASAAPTPPTYPSYVGPAPLGRDSGEPSIGSNWTTGNAMFQAGLETLRVSGLDTGNPSWSSVGSTITSTASLDPILFTDHATSRTFVSQLSADCSLFALATTTRIVSDSEVWSTRFRASVTITVLKCGVSGCGGGPRNLAHRPADPR